jgi:NADH:ubiquinone oxidoreductase subunit 6 (subunit J)
MDLLIYKKMNSLLIGLQVLTYAGLGILFTLVSVFPHSGKTVVNILRFLGVIFAVAVLIYANLHLEFFAILLLMIYGGAIVVNILFAVLSYDITAEFRADEEEVNARII